MKTGHQSGPWMNKNLNGNKVSKDECNQPAVSVVIPSYNSSRYIRKCLSSLRDQDCDIDFEVILVDSSNDGTGEIVEKEFPEARLAREIAVSKAGLAKEKAFGPYAQQAQQWELEQRDRAWALERLGMRQVGPVPLAKEGKASKAALAALGALDLMSVFVPRGMAERTDEFRWKTIGRSLLASVAGCPPV